MRILPIDPAANPSPKALGEFLRAIQAEVRADNTPRLASISIEAERLDPLAVLESIHEPGELHFYAEHPSQNWAIAGAEAVLWAEFHGAERFAKTAAFVRATLANTVAVGCAQKPFAGPHFFTSFTFAENAPEAAPFPPARVFVPRWQVARAAEHSIAVANILIRADDDLTPIIERIWRAHAKFAAFEYAQPHGAKMPARILSENEVGGPAAFSSAVRTALNSIENARYQKIVLARAIDIQADQPLDALRALNALRERFPDCTTFSLGNTSGASFIGATPERLLQTRNNTLRTEALAGSAPRGRTASEDASLARQLLQSEKDLREHALVLDSIARRLARVGIEIAPNPRPHIRQFPNVQHLHTPIETPLPAGADALKILGELHPTPAVGGTPRAPAIAHLQSLESFDRGLYAGALGWIDHRGDTEFFVGIRSALIDGKTARLFAGAGIVAGSDPVREQAETDLKFRPLRDALAQQI